jgi:negative regulator of flagellin synthesis FlgM
MDINKISGADKIVNTGKTKVNYKADVKDVNDKLNISNEAKQMAEIRRSIDIVNNASDIRLDKVEEAKRLIESGEYSNKEILDKIADKLLKNLGI